jgi:hypothetical protein
MRNVRRAHVAPRVTALLVGLVVALPSVGACHDGVAVSSGACNEHPFECALDETCWPNAQSTAFACIAAGAGKKGDACQLVAGQPSCGPSMVCIMVPGASTGTCRPYCVPPDENHQCPSGEVCTLFTLQQSGGSIDACVPKG